MAVYSLIELWLYGIQILISYTQTEKWSALKESNMLTWVFIFLGAVDLTAVLILIGLAIATLEEICRREVTNKMRWIDPNPGKDERSIKQDREIKRSFMSRPELRNKEAEKWFRRKPYGKEK